MKVYYIVKSNLHYYPPCVSQIRILNDLGANVVALYGSADQKIIEELQSIGVECHQLRDPRNKYPGMIDKVNNWLSFRRSLKGYLTGIDPSDSVLWFGNAETLLPMKGCLSKWQYIASFLELLDHSKTRLKLLKPLAQKAKVVTTCEETRSHLMWYWFKLAQTPYTIPNKPYAVPYKRGALPTTPEGKDLLNKIGNAKYVIYQGIFQNPEYINTIAQVMEDNYPEMYLVLMGIDKYHVVEKAKYIHNKTISIDYIPAPQHLQITANAYIGVLFYKPDSLNKIFCAPNKIFEYSYFGLPIIGNNIPGLENTIGRANAGICSDFTYDDVKRAFMKIIDNYEYYSKNALEFYDSVDNVKTIQAIMKDTGLLRGV